jgi:hypothetical protein
MGLLPETFLQLSDCQGLVEAYFSFFIYPALRMLLLLSVLLNLH